MYSDKNEKSDSQKVAETKEKIKESFFELYEQKKIEKISIKEITDSAGYNRGTFYVHYQDIYDLLEQIEDEFIRELSNAISDVLKGLMQNEASVINFFPFAFFKKNKKYLKVLLGVNGNGHFVYKVKDVLKGVFMGKIKTLIIGESAPGVAFDYVFEYISSAQVGLIIYWMDHDEDMSIEELAQMVLAILNKGPFTYLREGISG